jgi:16S rRNA (guanine966-N2)-methyltransferase
MRIIAGEFRGRKINRPESIRPTKDRIRESIFNMIGQYMPGKAILDVFSGSGAYGLEALSRGAGKVTFVENNRECTQVIKENIDILGAGEKTTVIRAEAEKALKNLGEQKESFDIVFCDPPYAKDMAKKALNMIYQYDILMPSGMLVIEHHKGEVLPESIGDLSLIKSKTYRYTNISIYNNNNE